MEKISSDLNILENYQDQQVILNYYETGDYLVRRDGFHFHSIELEKDSLLFSKVNGGTVLVTIPDQSIFYVDNQFPHYYILKCATDRIEIYFPG